MNTREIAVLILWGMLGGVLCGIAGGALLGLIVSPWTAAFSTLALFVCALLVLRLFWPHAAAAPRPLHASTIDLRNTLPK